ncbi:hypothetical protein C7B61_02425 [filamentous cyanobacterium CCP1]|nr:hypothetical protein C7B76_02685 [filamentous cyanobacterium CCP2]PSB68149.1 hypothetical protein C7B61_02425 [filamentous cyanobacterium CCP1]
MKVKYLAIVAAASAMAVGLAVLPGKLNPTQANPGTEQAQANPCAGVNPCASADPCAGANPCASADPCAGASTTTSPQIYAENGLAIEGADPVAYFTQGEAMLGSSEFEYEWNGATWRFTSAEHRDLFASSPEAYAPQYGGYCAYAVSQGGLASIDPEAWRIVDGKLYLNYDAQVQQIWNQDIPGYIASADANWPAVLQ